MNCRSEPFETANPLRKLTMLALFDFSKAFDCIPHKVLLLKLQKMDISGLPLARFFNYLQGRQQAVRINRAYHSGYRLIESSVLQGSVLGPLLYELYSNDLPTVPVHCKCRRYADDTQVYLHTIPAEVDNTLELVEPDAQTVLDRAVVKGLELNAKKTHVIILSSSPNVSAIDLANLRKIRINNMTLKYAAVVKNLVIIMN